MNRNLELVIALLARQLKGIDDDTLRTLIRLHRADPDGRFEERLAHETKLSSQEAQLLLRLAQELIRSCGGNTTLALTSLLPEHELEELFGDLMPPELQPDLQTAVMPDDAFFATPEEIMPLVDELEGRYTYVSDQGKGGMGRVLLVHDTNTDREVALKELLPKTEHEGTSKESPIRGLTQVAARFLQEGRVTAQLEHPAIVPVYEIGKRRNGTLYYTMKLVRGETLLSTLRKCNSIRERLTLLTHFVDLCQAIAYAHAKGVIHRDIKPNNVMIGEFGETVVLDWGIAHVTTESDIFETEIRQGGRVLRSGDDSWQASAYGKAIGTPHYMSPEQAEGDISKMGPHSDVYSLGVVLYELLTGKVPFEGRNPQTVIEKVLNESPTPILELIPDAPPELVSICERAMARDPKSRYSTAGELAEEILRFQSGRYVTAYEYPLREIARRYYQKHKPLVQMATAAAVSLIIVLAGAYWNISAARDREAAQRQIAEAEAYDSKIRLADIYRNEGHFVGMQEALKTTPAHLRHWEWGHLMAYANQAIQTLSGHESFVRFAEYLPEGDLVVTVGEDRQLRVWNPETAESIFIEDFESRVYFSAFAPDGKTLALAFEDGSILFYEPRTGNRRHVFQAHENAHCYSLSFSADGSTMITAGADSSVALWSYPEANAIARWRAQDMEQLYAELSSDGVHALSWSERERITLWDVQSGDAIGSFDGYRARFSPDGQRFTHLLHDRAVVRETATGRMLWETATTVGRMEQAIWSADGAYLLSTARHDNAHLWNGDTGRLINALTTESPSGTRFAGFSPDQQLVVITDYRGAMEVWEIASGKRINLLSGHEVQVGPVAWSPDGTFLISSSTDRTARIWSARDSMLQDTLVQHRAPVLAMDHHGPTGNFASLGQDHTLALGKANDPGQALRVSLFSPDLSKHVAIRPDGAQIAVTLDSFIPMLLDPSDGSIQHMLNKQDERVTCLAYSPDGQSLATGTERGLVRLWDTQSGDVIQEWQASERWLSAIAWHPDNQYIATDSKDGVARSWRVADGTRQMEFAHQSNGMALHFFNEGRQLLTAAPNNAFQIWDTASGKALDLVQHNDSSLRTVSISDDNHRVISSGYLGQLRLIHGSSGAMLAGFPLDVGPVNKLVWSGADAALYVGGGDGRVLKLHAVDWRNTKARPDAVHAGTESAESRFRQARKERLLQAQAAEATPWRIYVSGPVMGEALPALLRGVSAEANEGVTVPNRSLLEWASPLCLYSGDTLVSLDGIALTTSQDREEAALRAQQAAQSLSPLSGEMRRETDTYTLQFYPLPLEVTSDELTVPKEDVAHMLELLENLLLAQSESILRVSHDFAEARGKRLRGDQLYGHVLQAPWDDTARQVYRQFQLTGQERIVSIDGTAITGIRQYIDLIQSLRTRLDQNNLQELSIEIQRGELRERHMKIVLQ